jgi:hypothetical protein
MLEDCLNAPEAAAGKHHGLRALAFGQGLVNFGIGYSYCWSRIARQSGADGEGGKAA